MYNPMVSQKHTHMKTFKHLVYSIYTKWENMQQLSARFKNVATNDMKFPSISPLLSTKTGNDQPSVESMNSLGVGTVPSSRGITFVASGPTLYPVRNSS